MKPEYISGYDVSSGLWAVGQATRYGTIAKVVERFVEPEEARSRAAELNNVEPSQ
jgi:hypothetical protein